MTTFQVNETYKNNFIGDSNLYVSYKVIKRTAQFVTVKSLNDGNVVRCKVHNYKGDEYIYPMGRHSMAFTLGSDKIVQEEKPNPRKALNGWDGFSKRGEAAYDAVFEQEKAEALSQDCKDYICTCCPGSKYYGI